MLSGFKHAVQCTKCKEKVFIDNYKEVEEVTNKKSKCCGASQEYVGLQPYVQPVLVYAKPIVAKPIVDNLKTEETMKLVVEEKPKVAVETATMSVGKRGKMTTVIMRDLVRAALENGDLEKVRLLKTEYQKEYDDCLRYIPAKLKKLL